MTPATRYLAFSVFAVLGLAATGCADDPLAPGGGQNKSPAPSTAVASHLRPLVSNSVKYRDAGKKPGTGRSGSASLTARALMGRDRETLLEVTTGELDIGATAPGNLDKVQIKELDPDGVVINTANYNKLRNGGYASYGIKSMARGGGVQVQANVGGIDPTRTDVVTVLETVKLRPDLQVSGLAAPERAAPYAPVTIGVAVSELNGDVGANANCVLYLDGAEADRADDIWVDANGTVSCAFTTRFTSTGTKTIKVAAENARPGDWDVANNSVTGSIVIANPEDFSWSAYAVGHTYSYFNRVDWRWNYGPDQNGVTETGQNGHRYDNAGRRQYAGMYGRMPTETAFPLARLEIRQASNGGDIVSATYTDLPADYAYTYDYGHLTGREACVSRSTPSTVAGDTHFHVCSRSYTYSAAYGSQTYASTDISQHRFAGEVTYWSHQYADVRYRNADGSSACGSYYCYSYNYDYAFSSSTGMPLPTLGTDYTLGMVLSTSDGATYSNNAVVPLHPFDYSYDSGPYTCYPWNYGYYFSGENCYEYRYHDTGAAGSASGQPAAAAIP